MICRREESITLGSAVGSLACVRRSESEKEGEGLREQIGGRNRRGRRGDGAEPCVAVDGVSQELVVVLLQVSSGEIHGNTAEIIHRVDVEVMKRTKVFVAWCEVLVGLFDAIHQGHVQQGAWTAELNDNLTGVDGVAGSALASCWSDRLACQVFSFVVALLLRDRRISLKEFLYLHSRQS